LLSVTEGEDKPLKYPTIFNSADVSVISKMDLAEAVEYNRATADRNIQAVRPGMRVLRVSAKTEKGMSKWLELLVFTQEARFFFASLKANSSNSTRSRTMRSTHLFRPASRCNLAKKAARAAKSPGMDTQAGFDRLTGTGASQAESFSDCEITSRSMAS
jgi:G3E family GTPase